MLLGVNSTEWARVQRIGPCAAYRWFRQGTLPIPAQRGPRTTVVNIYTVAAPDAVGGLGLYAHVSSHDQKPDLERRVARLSQWAAKEEHRVVRVESEIASGINGSRSKARLRLAGSDVTTIVVEYADRLGWMDVELVEAALVGHGRRPMALDDGAVEDDLVRNMGQALTSLFARPCGRRSARNRAGTVLEAARHG
ncbi:IS607 family transposase [Actinoallomurus vinaceus]